MPASVTYGNNSEPILNQDHRLHIESASTSQRVVKSDFASCHVGGMLLLKLIGFIEDQRAEIHEISDRHIVMQLGRPWYSRWWHGGERRRPVRVRLDFADAGDGLPTWQKASARRSIVSVDIRPMALSYGSRDFHRRAQGVLRNLRLHFLAD
ncbi:MAG: hypothetical protein KDA86_09740 [Planctomycetaceae bacterium]|nr:hypothetical protein [Planctomycetaceae bacterium]